MLTSPEKYWELRTQEDRKCVFKEKVHLEIKLVTGETIFNTLQQRFCPLYSLIQGPAAHHPRTCIPPSRDLNNTIRIQGPGPESHHLGTYFRQSFMGVFPPAGVRVFPAGILQIPQEILTKIIEHIILCCPFNISINNSIASSQAVFFISLSVF